LILLAARSLKLAVPKGYRSTSFQGKNMHIIIAGATGLIGRSLLNNLDEQQCEKVTALTRREFSLPFKHQHIAIVDYNELKLESAADDSDAVICALGTTIKSAGSKQAFEAVDYGMVIALATKAKQEGYKTFAVVSSLGADKPGSNFYLSTKHKMESSLQSLGFDTLIIARPSLLLGNREEFRLGERMGEWLSFALGPLMIGPLKKYKPIHATQVARALINQSKANPSGLIILENNQLHDF
jgi:uncharacterized protein YbjT (DUF2867 family)